MRGFIISLLLFSFTNLFGQAWACYPLASGGSMVCGWACYSGHQGQDWQYMPYNTSYGQNIYAVESGTVVYIETGWTGCDDPFVAGGNDWNQPSNKIIIQHGNGLYTRYVHIMGVEPNLVVGSWVNRGQVIAYIGNVGPISPCDNNDPNVNAHLHFEVGTGWSSNTLTGRFDPASIFDGCYPPYCCGSTSVTDANCTGIFFDSGGPNATYSNNENYVLTIAPTGALNVSINFWWIDLEPNYDYLYIYDGPNTSSSLFGAYTGTVSPGYITSTGPELTLQFISDNDILYQGWSSDWACTLPGTQIAEGSGSQKLRVYPNPAKNSITFNELTSMSTVSIFNALGICVKEIPSGSGRTGIDISEFSPGIYTIRCGKAFGKFIKE